MSKIWCEAVLNSNFPNNLKLADITATFKAIDATCDENYRPISVLPVVSKLFERIMQNKLFPYFEDFLSPFLCGYRKGYSTQYELLCGYRKGYSTQYELLCGYRKGYSTQYELLCGYRKGYSTQYALLCGYRKGYSTQYVLLGFIKKWKHTLDNRGYAGAILMGLSKAFDTINNELLLAKLYAYGFERNALRLIRSYLIERWQRTKINQSFSSWA